MSVEDADSHKVAQRLIEELLNTPGGGNSARIIFQ